MQRYFRFSFFLTLLCLLFSTLIHAKDDLPHHTQDMNALLVEMPALKASPNIDPQKVNLWLKNVHLNLTPKVAIDIRELMGEFVSERADAMVSLDKLGQVKINVAAGRIFVSEETLDVLINEDLFIAKSNDVRHVNLAITPENLEIRAQFRRNGKWRNLLAYGQLRVSGPMSVSIKMTDVRVDGVFVSPAMFAADIRLSDVMQIETSHLSMRQNDLILNLEAFFPQPDLKFVLKEFQLVSGGLELLVGDAALLKDWPPHPKMNSYMLVRGGQLKASNVRIKDAYVVIIDENMKDLSFDLHYYRQQLQKSFQRIRPDGFVLAMVPAATVVNPNHQYPLDMRTVRQ